MKPNYLTILITTLCIFFNACHNSNTAPQLQLADSLIDKRADSAYAYWKSYLLKKYLLNQQKPCMHYY